MPGRNGSQKERNRRDRKRARSSSSGDDDCRNDSRLRRLLRRQLAQGKELIESLHAAGDTSKQASGSNETKWTAKDWAEWEEKCRKKKEKKQERKAQTMANQWDASTRSGSSSWATWGSAQQQDLQHSTPAGEGTHQQWQPDWQQRHWQQQPDNATQEQQWQQEPHWQQPHWQQEPDWQQPHWQQAPDNATHAAPPVVPQQVPHAAPTAVHQQMPPPLRMPPPWRMPTAPAPPPQSQQDVAGRLGPDGILAEQRQEGVSPSRFCATSGLGVRHVLPDFLHTVDLGVAAQMQQVQQHQQAMTPQHTHMLVPDAVVQPGNVTTGVGTIPVIAGMPIRRYRWHADTAGTMEWYKYMEEQRQLHGAQTIQQLLYMTALHDALMGGGAASGNNGTNTAVPAAK